MEKSTQIFTIIKYQKKVLFICLSVILINSVLRTCKNYYAQVFLEECKYVAKEKKIHKYIIDDIEIFSDSDEENSDEKNLKNTNITHILKLIFVAYKNFFFIIFFLYIKMIKTYYKKNKEKLLKEACERYQNLSEEEKEKSVSIITIKIRIFLKK